MRMKAATWLTVLLVLSLYIDFTFATHSDRQLRRVRQQIAVQPDDTNGSILSSSQSSGSDDDLLDKAIDSLAASESQQSTSSGDGSQVDVGDGSSSVEMTVQDNPDGETILSPVSSSEEAGAGGNDDDLVYRPGPDTPEYYGPGLVENDSGVAKSTDPAMSERAHADLSETSVEEEAYATPLQQTVLEFGSSPSSPYTMKAVVNNTEPIVAMVPFPANMWGTEGFSLSAKVRMPEAGSYNAMQALIDRGQGGFRLFMRSGTFMTPSANKEDVGMDLSSLLPPGSTHYVGFTFDATPASPIRKVFVDGILIRQDSFVPQTTAGSDQASLGGDNDQPTDANKQWKGYICSFRLWKGVVSDQDMKSSVTGDASSREGDECGPLAPTISPPGAVNNTQGPDHPTDSPVDPIDVPSPYQLTNDERTTYFHFGGSTGVTYSKVPAAPLGVSARTYEAWIKIDPLLASKLEASTHAALIGWGNYTHDRLPLGEGEKRKVSAVWDVRLYRKDGKFHVFATGMPPHDEAGEGAAASYSLEEDTWAHIAVVWNGAEIRVILNGNLVSTVKIKYPTDDPPFFTRPGEFFLAAEPAFDSRNEVIGSTAHFNGDMREVRVWNAALDTETIKKYSHFTWPCHNPKWKWTWFFHPYAMHLVGMWPFTEGSGTEVKSCMYHASANGKMDGEALWKKNEEGPEMKPGPGPQAYLKNSLPTKLQKNRLLFSYDMDDMDYGPLAWGKLSSQCGSANQSPVNIQSNLATEIDKNTQVPPQLRVLYQSSLDSHVRGDKHTFSVIGNRVSVLTLNERVYHLSEVRFHIPSEHQLNGQNFDGEIQLLHEDREGRFSYATGDYSLLVVSVFITKGGGSNPYIATMLNNQPNLNEGDTHIMEPLNPHDLLPLENMRPYYEYEGRLTAPPCSRAKWIVLQTPIKITDSQYDAMRKGMAPRNTRPLQDMSKRAVYKGKMPSIDLSDDEFHSTK